MTDTYFDLDNILSEEERIPCVFNLDAVGMGMLDPTSVDEDITQGTKVEFPMWMARYLHLKAMVDIELPKHYADKARDQLDAGAGAVNLRNKSPFYYEVGGVLARLCNDKPLQDKLLSVFSGDRFRRLLDCSLNSLNEDITPITRELPYLERRLFDAGYQASEEYVRWKSRTLNKLSTSKVLQGKSKRQRTALT
ncbi:unnamed protein product [Discosporangium mesarthrocarpum]